MRDFVLCWIIDVSYDVKIGLNDYERSRSNACRVRVRDMVGEKY